jgi:hypothetical protein
MSRAVEEAEALLNMGATMVDAGTLRAVLDELKDVREMWYAANRAVSKRDEIIAKHEAQVRALRQVFR